MNQKLLIALNTFSNYARLGVRTIIGILLAPYVLACVGEVANGIYLEVLAFVGLMLVLDIGISAAVMRYVARESALEDERACQEIWLSSLVAYAVPGLITLGLFVAAAPWMARVLHTDAAHRPVAIVLLMIAGVMFAFEFPSNAYRGVLLGLQKRFAIVAFEITADIVRAVSIVIMLKWWTTDIVWVMVATAATAIAANIGLALAVHVSCRWARFDRTAIRWGRLRSILGYSLATAVAQVGFTLNLYMHRLLIGILLGPTFVTVYYFAGQFRDIVETALTYFTTTIIPVTAKYQALNDVGVLRALMIRGSRYAVIAAGLIAAPLAAFSEPLLRTWLYRTPELAAWAPLMAGLLGLCLLELTRGASNAILMGLARVKLLGAVNLAGVLVDGAVAFALLKTTSLGLYAILVSTGVAVVFRRSILTAYACRVIGVPLRTFMVRCVLAPLLPAIVAYAAGRLLLQYVDAVGWVRLIGWGTLSGTAGVAVAAAITLTSDERRELAHPFQAAWDRLVPRKNPRERP